MQSNKIIVEKEWLYIYFLFINSMNCFYKNLYFLVNEIIVPVLGIDPGIDLVIIPF